MKPHTRILPRTPWAASSLWSFEIKPLIVLILSLSLFGVGEGLLVLGALGSTPWTVLAQGISHITQLSLGWVTFLISVVVMLLWIPLRLRAGLGTVLNIVVIAAVLGWFVQQFNSPNEWWGRVLLCVSGVITIGVASSLYLTCHLGAGPRDGLMVGLCQRTGWRVGIVRTLLEVSVCGMGWFLGGTLGIGTLLFAFGVGWVVQISLKIINKYASTPP